MDGIDLKLLRGVDEIHAESFREVLCRETVSTAEVAEIHFLKQEDV